MRLNSIEQLQVSFHREWSLLPLDDRVAKTFEIVGVALQNKILVFGGTMRASICMHAFTEDGEFI